MDCRRSRRPLGGAILARSRNCGNAQTGRPVVGAAAGGTTAARRRTPRPPGHAHGMSPNRTLITQTAVREDAAPRSGRLCQYEAEAEFQLFHRGRRVGQPRAHLIAALRQILRNRKSRPSTGTYAVPLSGRRHVRSSATNDLDEVAVWVAHRSDNHAAERLQFRDRHLCRTAVRARECHETVDVTGVDHHLREHVAVIGRGGGVAWSEQLDSGRPGSQDHRVEEVG
ncbi:hypothetical protein RHA1_ro09033 (plasmid) [Rhodococcus jostii RHA1]|uniref:Uncharacterized protein n=1 Tax=Rhodococcus jostii (strain RHA1) TaxID=101510 RepID=Q0RXA9_RHOJR|nr:hypothetical protein RHA1_ro09033 [Rhodococcus jostii RHA1]